MLAPLCTLPLTGNSLLLKTDSCLLAPDPGSPLGTPLVFPLHQVGASLGVTPCRAGPSRCAPNLVHFSSRSLQACPSQLCPAVLQSPHDTALTLPGPQGRESRNPPPPDPELNPAAASRYGGLSRGWSAFHRPWPALQDACPSCQAPLPLLATLFLLKLTCSFPCGETKSPQ